MLSVAINYTGQILMEKNKRFYLYITLGFLIAFISCNSAFNDNNYLSIQNLSEENVTDVRIEYSNGGQIKIGKLDASSETKIKLLNSANENAINLLYRDVHNVNHKVLVIPYLVLAENKNYNFKIK
jgi:hypothetical protein